MAAVRVSLRCQADPYRAPAMQAYMKSALPYYGVPMPAVKACCKEVFRQHPLSSAEDWLAAVLLLYRQPTHREERYAALNLAAFPAYRLYRTPALLPAYEELIVTGAWWDVVDDISGRLVRDLVQRYPEEVKPVMRAWSASDNLWKRRVSIICQVGLRRAADLDLLYACIEANLADKAFFIRKAIGWALRDYAWADPAEVQRYVRANEDRLSGLSRREALKNLTP